MADVGASAASGDVGASKATRGGFATGLTSGGLARHNHHMKLGRPKSEKPKHARVDVYTTWDTFQDLKAEATRRGVTVSALVEPLLAAMAKSVRLSRGVK